MKRTLEISEETYQKIKDQLSEGEKIDIKQLDDLIGKKFFFRTVTYHTVGMVTGRIGNLLVLEDAAWIADSGRFMDCIKNGEVNEVEPVGDCLLNLSTVVDAFPWNHELIKEQK